MTRTLALFDCSGIQSYIFDSNRLVENLGASALVERALGGIDDDRPEQSLLYQALVAACDGGPFRWSEWREHPTSLTLDGNSAVRAEVVFTGGGNAAVLFDSEERARTAISRWSLLLLEHAPGLRGVAGVVECPTDTFTEAYEKVRTVVGEIKRGRPVSGVPYRLPVVRACVTTGFAASVMNTKGDTEFVSLPASAKRKAAEDSRGIWEKRYPAQGYRYTDELQDLGGREGESHIAVVHIDGNGFGQRIGDAVRPGQSDREAVARLRNASLAAAATVRKAMGGAIEHLVGWLDAHPDHPLRLGPQRTTLPVRPIVEGGDDVTFVCDGRLGLPLAALFLRRWAEVSEAAGAVTSACAGVAVVPTSFPFRRAYDLAEHAVADAKKQRRSYQRVLTGETSGNGHDSSWIDWKIALAGGVRDDNAFVDVSRPPTARPWRVWETGLSLDNAGWESLAKQIRAYQAETQWPRSRVKGLRDALVSGAPAVERFVVQYASRRPDVTATDTSELHDPANFGKHYDAIEALDFYLDLEA